jgi:serine phosphatase RsbU (regulator of sigma subunit)
MQETAGLVPPEVPDATTDRAAGLRARRRRYAGRWAAIAALALGWTVVRLFIHDPGPAYLLPIALAAWWFGPWAGGATGAACTLLYAVSEAGQENGVGALSVQVAIRFVIYVGVGLAAGLFSTRFRLERREHERHLAELRAIQEALTPPLPDAIAGVDVAVSYLPAQQGVAGDFYLIAEGPEASAVLVVGDVVGKGLAASKLAWYVRTAISTAAQYTLDPSVILRLANATVLERRVSDDAFVTIACVVLDQSAGRLRWALAGHPAPILLDSGRMLERKGASGVPIGIDASPHYPARDEPLVPGEGILLYSDGLTEAHPATPGRPDLYGEERVRQSVQEAPGASPGVVVDLLTARASEHSRGTLPDDLCVVVARVRLPEQESAFTEPST